ncbi:EZH inhibitory protein [Phacochoerus africanus]|uniref:EZH inhibitory protein n=1 Tax=Phacochoerus africanus TaxID=41426 RepID=UPI001FDABF41|nr:EZH inhibitory protein [Phacochoerus africanus]
MATQSSLEKEQQPQQGEVPAEPKNGVTSAPGDTHETENPDPSALVSSDSGDRSPSGGGAPQGDTVSSSCDVADAGTISLTGADAGPPSVEGVQERGCPDLQGGGSSPAKLICLVLETGQGIQIAPSVSGAAIGQAAGGAGQRPTQTTSPGKSSGKKRPRGEEAAPLQKLPRRCLFPGAAGPQWSMPSPPSSPRSEPSSCGHSQASQQSNASPPPGPALRSKTKAPGPALCSQAARPGPALRRRSHATASGPALRSRSSVQGPALRRRSHATASGPALRSRSSVQGPALRRRSHATASGPALRSRSSVQGPALRRRSHATASGPALRSRSSVQGPALRRRSHATASGPALRSRSSVQGPALRRRSHATASGPALRSRSSVQGSCSPQSSSQSRPCLPPPHHAARPGSS